MLVHRSTVFVAAVVSLMALVAGPAAAVNVTLVADSFTQASAAKNNGTKKTIDLKAPAGGPVDKAGWVQFDLSTLPPGTTGADVEKATLTLFTNKVKATGSFDLHRVAGAWAEGAITGASPPALGPVEQSAVAVSAANIFVTADITAVVKDWLDSVLVNNGLALVPNSIDGLDARFDSKENKANSQVPRLEITLASSATSNEIDFGTPTGAENTRAGTGALISNTSGFWNTAVGRSALLANTTGDANTAVGRSALLMNTTGNASTALGSDALRNNTASYNTAVGDAALRQNTSGTNNTAVGQESSRNNTTGNANTAVGRSALLANTTGNANAALGSDALRFNTASYNTAVGDAALRQNTSGGDNTAIGQESLRSNSTGTNNTAVGRSALLTNTTGDANTAVGRSALRANSIGFNNTAIGTNALYGNLSGGANTAVGLNALLFNTTGGANTAVGLNALLSTTGNNNIAIGHLAGSNPTSGNDNIMIGTPGEAGDDRTIRIGDVSTQNAYIGGIHSTTTTGLSLPVYVNIFGKLGTNTSSRRFKEDIRDIGDASDLLLRLHPVSFRYKPEIDPEGTKQYGLIAEEVADVAPDLVQYDADGNVYSVRYHLLVPMLLNELQKLAAENEKLKVTDATLAARLDVVEQDVHAINTRGSQSARTMLLPARYASGRY